jgi:hypothetical protein
MRKKKKRSNKNTGCNEVRLKNVYVSGTLNLQQLRLSQNTKKYLYTCRTWSLTQKWVAKPINNKSNNTLKNVSDNTLKKKVITTAQEMVYKKIVKDQVGKIKRS